MDDNFNSGDRQTLIELRVDMRYTKEAMDRLSAEHASSNAEFTRDLKDIRASSARDLEKVWLAIEDLRAFRWRLVGGIGVANVVCAALARVLLK